jgi:hypothetical protein
MVPRGTRPYDVAMSVYLDDQPLDLAGGSLAEALAQARTRLAGSGRVLVEVKADGQALQGAELERRMHAAVGQTELRLGSADPRELSLTALSAVRARLAESAATQTQAADAFLRDDFPNALRGLGKAMEVWSQTPQALVKTAQMLGLPPEKLSAAGQTLDGLTADLARRLQAIHDLVAARDSVALADALTYEWPGVIAQWDALAAHLIEQISAQP